MRPNKYDYLALMFFALAGFLNACMDSKMFMGESSPLYAVFDWLGWRDFFLATGGNTRWRWAVLVWDFWHIAKNAMWLSIGIATYFATRGVLNPRVWIILAGVTVGVSFMLFFHIVLGARYV
ncbi:MAG: hypothetical protein L0Y80_01010 [Ignavibacteriae bacterium]|nr:hypothetical protein [Ignavibacteriota bacterium]